MADNNYGRSSNAEQATRNASDKASYNGTGSSVLAGGTVALAALGAMAMGADKTKKAYLMVRKPMTDKDYNREGASDLTDTELSATTAALRTLIKSAGASAAKSANDEKTYNKLIHKAKLEEGSAEEQSLKLALNSFQSMTVQYNPSSIQINAVAGGDYTQLQGPGDAGIRNVVQVTRPSSLTLRVQLVFDKINQTNAFSIYNQGFALGTVVNGVTSMVREYTIQPQVEGLISLLTYKNTRQVIFIWSEMFFHGELQGVEANYTMFNKQGKPIRATVDLMIKQSDSNKAFATDHEYWDKAFTKSFGEAGVATTSTTGSMTGTSTFF